MSWNVATRIQGSPVWSWLAVPQPMCQVSAQFCKQLSATGENGDDLRLRRWLRNMLLYSTWDRTPSVAQAILAGSPVHFRLIDLRQDIRASTFFTWLLSCSNVWCWTSNPIAIRVASTRRKVWHAPAGGRSRSATVVTCLDEFGGSIRDSLRRVIPNAINRSVFVRLSRLSFVLMRCDAAVCPRYDGSRILYRQMGLAKLT